MGFLLAGVVLGACTVMLLQRFHAQTKQPPSLQSLVQWGAIPRNGLLWLKDGALCCTWEIRGPDLGFATIEQAESLAHQFNRALISLSGRHMLHLDCCRVPATSYASGSGFGSATGHLLDELSRAKYEKGINHENRYFLTLTGMPSEGMYQRLNSVLIHGSDRAGVDWEAELDAFERTASALDDLMPQPIKRRRLSTSEQLSYLSYLLKGSFQTVNAPPDPDFVDCLFDQSFRPGFQPVIDDSVWHRVVSVQGYAPDAFMGILRGLDDLDFPFRFSTRIIGIEPTEVNAMIKKRMERWFQKREGGKDLLEQLMSSGKTETNDVFLDAFADEQALDAQQAYKESQSGLVRYLVHTACVIVRGEDLERVNAMAAKVKKVFAHQGFIAKIEQGNATEAWLGSLPGHGHHNVRRSPVRSDYITRMLPLSCVYAGPTKNPSKLYPKDSPVLFYAQTAESVPYRFTPYVGQVGHTAIVGPTGSGKSILMGHQGYRHQQYENSQTILFDNGGSFALLCEAMNGQRYEVGGDGMGFQPLGQIQDVEERRWAADWLATLCQLQGLDVGPYLREVISDTLAHMADLAAHNPAYLTMGDFETQVQDEAIRAALSPYAGKGAMGQLLNANHDSISGTRFQVYEVSSIIDLSPKLVTPVFLYIFHRIQKLLGAKKPTYVGADEFFLLAAKSEAGRRYCMEALRTYRKHNAMMVLATQDAADLIPSDHGDDLSAVLNSCRTRIYLPNPDALEPSQMAMYLQHGLNEREIKEIANAKPQRDYIVRQPTGTRRFDLGLSRELAFLTPLPGLTISESVARLRECKAEHGDLWLNEWLRRRGYPAAAEAALAPAHRRRAAREVSGAPPASAQQTPALSELTSRTAPA